MSWLIGTIGLAFPILLYRYLKALNPDLMNILRNFHFFFPPDMKSEHKNSLCVIGKNENIDKLKYYENYSLFQMALFVNSFCIFIIMIFNALGFYLVADQIMKNMIYIFLFSLLYFIYTMFKIKIKERAFVLNENLFGIGFSFFYLLIVIAFTEKTDIFNKAFYEFFSRYHFYFEQYNFYYNNSNPKILLNFGKFFVFFFLFVFLNLQLGYLLTILSSIRKINKDIELNKLKKEKNFQNIIKNYEVKLRLFYTKILVNLLSCLNMFYILKLNTLFIIPIILINSILEYCFFDIQLNNIFSKTTQICLSLENYLQKKIKNTSKEIVNLKERYYSTQTICNVIYQDSVKTTIVVVSRFLLSIFFLCLLLLIFNYKKESFFVNRKNILDLKKDFKSFRNFILFQNKSVKNDDYFREYFFLELGNKNFIKYKFDFFKIWVNMILETSPFFLGFFYSCFYLFETVAFVALVVFIQQIKF